MDPLSAAHVTSRETWQGVARGVAVALAAAFIVWRAPVAEFATTAKYAMLVLLVVASPGPLRSVIAPRLARLLKD